MGLEIESSVQAESSLDTFCRSSAVIVFTAGETVMTERQELLLVKLLQIPPALSAWWVWHSLVNVWWGAWIRSLSWAGVLCHWHKTVREWLYWFFLSVLWVRFRQNEAFYVCMLFRGTDVRRQLKDISVYLSSWWNNLLLISSDRNSCETIMVDFMTWGNSMQYNTD